jgi:hypothetical protein
MGDNRNRGPEQDKPAAGRELPDGSRPASLAVACPFCGGTEVELFSLFGSQLLTSEYYCRHCRTVFENVKR